MRKKVKRNRIFVLILIFIAIAILYFVYNYIQNGVLFSPTHAIGITRISVTAKTIVVGALNPVMSFCPSPRLAMKNDLGVEIFNFEINKNLGTQTVVRDGRSDNLSFTRSMNSTRNLNFSFVNDCYFQREYIYGIDVLVYNITVDGVVYPISRTLSRNNDSVTVNRAAECSDGGDNDDDGFIDLLDSGCLRDRKRNTEVSYDSDSWTIVDGAYVPQVQESSAITTYASFHVGSNPHTAGVLMNESGGVVAQDSCHPFYNGTTTIFIVDEYFYYGNSVHETFFKCGGCNGNAGVGLCEEVPCNVRWDEWSNPECFSNA